MQTITLYLFSDRKRLILSGLLIVSILTGTFVLIGSLRPFHASAASATTCVQAPTAEHCNNQDPIAQGCVADAQIRGDETIEYFNVNIGDVQLRYSPSCQSWWGRVFDYRIAANTPLGLQVGGNPMVSAPPTFASNQYRILYSPMIFAQTSPLVTGTVEVDGANPFPSTTFPAGLLSA